MKNNICLIYNFAQHYRSNIFNLMDKEMPVDFVFGDKYLDVKKMDYSLLQNFKKEVKNKTFIRKPLYYQKGVLSLLREEYSCFLVLGESICVSTWLLLFFSRFLNKKVYLWTHGWYGKETRFRKIMKKIFFSMSDGVFLYGNYAKGLMINEGINPDKLHVIYNSLDYDAQLLLRANLKQTKVYVDHFLNNDLNLIFVGRLTSVKRLDILLHALAELKSRSKKFNLTLVGDGEERKHLELLTKNLGLDRMVWFYGPCYDEKALSNLIYNADLCVSPGNVGLTAIHAMSYGTPVLTHSNFKFQMPEFEAIEEGETGLFFECNDPHSLSESILQWFSVAPERSVTRVKCYSIIDTRYNPHIQVATLKKYIKP
ncbi:MAG: glycosyltransferase [Bacteroidales bacterium]|nr:glycosyltransferase [Bacteroidales bacterium]